MEVERRNHACLNAIQQRPYEYRSLDTPGFDQFGQLHNGDKLEAILDRLIAPNLVILKVNSNLFLFLYTPDIFIIGTIGWSTSHVSQGELQLMF